MLLIRGGLHEQASTLKYLDLETSINFLFYYPTFTQYNNVKLLKPFIIANHLSYISCFKAFARVQSSMSKPHQRWLQKIPAQVQKMVLLLPQIGAGFLGLLD
jgi:hypothetical protein